MSSQRPPLPADVSIRGPDWGGLDWREKRARRFARWLDPPGVDFVDEDVRARYQERVRLFVDAIELRRSTRAPCSLSLSLYALRYSGLSVREAMYDVARASEALWSMHEAFPLLDLQCRPYTFGPAFDLMGARSLLWPGNGLGDDQPWQYVEAEYMAADEYDELIADPSAYFLRRYLPRVADAFAPLASFAPAADLTEPDAYPSWLLPFADPALQESLARLTAAATSTLEAVRAYGAVAARLTAERGLPGLSPGIAKAPYDVIADGLRGTVGIAKDLFRRPDKILEAAERFVPLQIASGIRQAERSACPIILMPLHKGADGFMSDAAFRDLYWPTLKAVVKGLVAEGLVPRLFAEGSYDRRLSAIADDDLPDGAVIWHFDATDMTAARRVLSGHACVSGNIPAALLAIGSADDVAEYVRTLLDQVAGDGGFILSAGSVVTDARPGNLQAVLETARRWRYS